MTETKNIQRTLLHGPLLARNALVNLLGYLSPIIIAFIAIPLLIKGLGTERFGVLSLAWMVAGYFGFFDLGAGRATTKFAADYAVQGDSAGLTRLVWTSIILLFCFGTAGGGLFAVLNPLLVNHLLKVPAPLREETIASFHLLAVSIPIILTTAGLRGVLEAQQRFGLINAIKIPVSAATFGAPLLVMLFSRSLAVITASLLLIRLVEFIAYSFYCFQSVPGMRRLQLPTPADVKKLLGYGGWVTISNIVSPLMSYMDRFIVGAFMTMSAVAYYATSYDLVMKLGIFADSVLIVMFPALSAAFVTDTDRLSVLYERSIKYIMLFLAPIVLIVIVMAEPLMEFWLGREFAVQSRLVLQILAIGIFINSVARGPFSAIQAMGRPDITAKLHAFELPFYAAAIVLCIVKMGIVGAALAWLMRVVFDTMLLFRFSHRLLPATARQTRVLIGTFAGITALLSAALSLSALANGWFLKSVLSAVLAAVLISYIWLVSLDVDERRKILFFRSYLAQ